jgi:hypothetical protein
MTERIAPQGGRYPPAPEDVDPIPQRRAGRDSLSPLGAPAAPSSSPAAPAEPPDPKGTRLPLLEWSKRSKRLAVVAILVVAAVLVVGYIPLPFSFSGVAETPGNGEPGPVYSTDFPADSPVSGTWTGNGSGLVTLSILAPSGALVFTGMASSGLFSFESRGGAYRFSISGATPETVTIHGSYSETMFHWVEDHA